MKAERPQTPPKPKAKSVSIRKSLPPKEEETPEQKAAREKAEREAEQQAKELIRQEQEEKEKQAAKDAKSKKVAAENTEKAREAACLFSRLIKVLHLRGENCLQNAHFLKQKGPFLKTPLNWTGSVFHS